MHSIKLAAVLLLVATSTPAAAHDIVRRANSGFPIANSVTVPAGAELVYLSGMLADAADTSAPVGRPATVDRVAGEHCSGVPKTVAGPRSEPRLPTAHVV